MNLGWSVERSGDPLGRKIRSLKEFLSRIILHKTLLVRIPLLSQSCTTWTSDGQSSDRLTYRTMNTTVKWKEFLSRHRMSAVSLHYWNLVDGELWYDRSNDQLILSDGGSAGRRKHLLFQITHAENIFNIDIFFPIRVVREVNFGWSSDQSVSFSNSGSYPYKDRSFIFLLYSYYYVQSVQRFDDPILHAHEYSLFYHQTHCIFLHNSIKNKYMCVLL